MPLIQCKECDKEVSDKAWICPGCGYPIKKRDYGPLYLFLITIGMLLFAVYLGRDQEQQAPAVAQQPVKQTATKPPEPVQKPQKAPSRPPVVLRGVRVAIWDETVNRPVHNKAEIWFRDHGSWFLKRELEHKGTFKVLGKRPADEEIEPLYFYPEGRKLGPDGRELYEIKIDYRMTKEMAPKGSPRDTIRITFYDDHYRIEGLPIKAATGATTQIIAR